MIFIYSANEKEAEQCAEKHNLASHEWKYLAAEEQLFGLTEFTVWAYGGWLKRFDSMRIEQIVVERRGTFNIL